MIPIVDSLALGTALIMGLSHALEIDHVLSVTAFVSRRPTVRSATGFGVRWGIGHSAAVLAAGTAILILDLNIPTGLESVGEALVGAMLIGLGIWALLSAGKLPTHATDGHPTRHRRGVGVVGVLHGLAGTGGVVALVPVALVDRTAVGIGYLLAFSAGVILAMGLFATAAAMAMQRAEDRSLRWAARAARTVGVAGILVGGWWVVRALG